MEPWNKYFIVDTSVKEVVGLRFGRGYMGPTEGMEPQFTTNPNLVKLYDTEVDAMTDFNIITNCVDIINITIQNTPQGAQVSHKKIAGK